MVNTIEEYTRIHTIDDNHKVKIDSKGVVEKIHSRRVEMRDGDSKLKIIFNDARADLPDVIRMLDEDDDLYAEVKVKIEVILVSRQSKITSNFAKDVKKHLDKEGIGYEEGVSVSLTAKDRDKMEKIAEMLEDEE